MKKIEITNKTIYTFLAAIVLFLLAWFTKDVLVILFISLIIIATLSPIINYLEKYLKWRTLAVLLVYLLIFFLLGLLISSLIPVVAKQSKELIKNFPNYAKQLSEFTSLDERLKTWVSSNYSIGSISEYITKSTQQIFQITGSFLSLLSALILIVVISFYGLIAEKDIKERMKKYFKEKKREKYWKIGREIYYRLGSWLRAQIVLAVIVALLTGIGLKILNVPYALSLGALAGILEIVPIIGPLFASLPALLIAFAISPFTGLLVLILFILIHQLESYVLVPKIMEKALGLSPVLILAALLIGGKLGGIIGVLIAVPLLSSILLTIQYTLINNEKISKKQKSQA